ncbi:MAG: NAD(P)-dependent oxidoreductase [Verrucomicrobiia bacterium]
MKVLLTGAAGFIGSHIARELVCEGHEVHALVRPNADLSRIADIQPSLHFIEDDLLSSSFILHPSSFDVCVHLAWYVEPGKYLHAPQNKDWVQASLRLARALKDAGCRRFIAAGTCFEYATSDPPQRESTPTAPSTPYVQSKLELFHALPSVGIDFAWVRFFYQYGPYEDPRRLMPVVINLLRRGQEAKLVAGDRIRDYLHIEDVASAVCAVAQSKLTGAVNIGSGQPVTVRDIVLKIGKLLDRVDLIKLGARPYAADEPMHLLADNTKLREGTGWKPRYDLESGLRQTIEWWKNR